ncbi:HIT family protein [Rhizobium sp. MHM7A]|uniref:HIT family protein n=1 Tax=Rhizobium sp. MHM7A TaxID=2583233 RepID=UPI00110665EF|nr:HIT family protein [Rhizobium sp. MHM7A]TLX16142.1 HIT family protein [Rhizobium sp. MHM7A]
MKFDPSIFNLNNPWFIGEMPDSYLVLNFDQSYLGRVILVPKQESPDLESLPARDVALLMAEVVYVGGRLKSEFSAARMNYASLGNVVEQLHWHIIPRYTDDANWGGPPWPVVEPREPSVDERAAIVARVRRALNIDERGIAQVEPEFPITDEFIDAYWRVVAKTLTEVFETSEDLGVKYRAKVDAAPFNERYESYQVTPLEVASRLAETEITLLHIDRYRPLRKILAMN